MDTVYTEKRHGLTITIMRDDMNENPSEWRDDGLFLIANHRDFYVEPPKPVRMADAYATYEKTHWTFPLEAYIHSSVRLALSQEGNFCDRQWDVSQLGAVFVSKKEWRTKAKAKEAARGLIDTWNEYLSGNVYGYEVKDEKGEHLDSCWGFYGDYDKDGGALLEARAAVDHLTHGGTTDQFGQRLFFPDADYRTTQTKTLKETAFICADCGKEKPLAQKESGDYCNECLTEKGENNHE